MVTGKLDVREAAARLPEENDEPELPDETIDKIDGDEDLTEDVSELPEEVEA